MKKKTNKTCKMYYDWLNKSWKFKFVVSELVVGSGEQDQTWGSLKYFGTLRVPTVQMTCSGFTNFFKLAEFAI